MPGVLTIVKTGDLILYDGQAKRCRCDQVNVVQNYDTGQRLAAQRTDDDGLLPEWGIRADAEYRGVHIKTESTFWRNVGVKCRITWDEDSFGTLGVVAIHLERR